MNESFEKKSRSERMIINYLIEYFANRLKQALQRMTQVE